MNILLIDDDQRVRQVTRALLGIILGDCPNFYEADTCDAGLLRLAGAPSIDLIVTDYNTPGQATGLDIIAAAQRRCIPAIMITGDFDALRPIFPAGNPQQTLLAKPFKKNELAKTLAQLISPQPEAD